MVLLSLYLLPPIDCMLLSFHPVCPLPFPLPPASISAFGDSLLSSPGSLPLFPPPWSLYLLQIEIRGQLPVLLGPAQAVPHTASQGTVTGEGEHRIVGLAKL